MTTAAVRMVCVERSSKRVRDRLRDGDVCTVERHFHEHEGRVMLLVTAPSGWFGWLDPADVTFAAADA